MSETKKSFTKYNPTYIEFLEKEVIRRYGKEGLRILRKRHSGPAAKTSEGLIYENMVRELSEELNASEIAAVAQKSRMSILYIKRKNEVEIQRG